jgi:hypothetical protein
MAAGVSNLKGVMHHTTSARKKATCGRTTWSFVTVTHDREVHKACFLLKTNVFHKIARFMHLIGAYFFE